MDRGFKELLEHTIECCKLNNTDLLIKNVNYVTDCGIKCTGYFGYKDITEQQTEMAVACKRPYEEWLCTLLHETCHMDQWIEDAKAWREGSWTVKQGYTMEALDLLSYWLDGYVELKPDILDKTLWRCAQLELDCEKRSVEKAKDFDLNINLEEYIQKANCYIFFYAMLRHTREWYNPRRSISSQPQLWKEMPKIFLKDREYKKVPEDYKKLFWKHLYNK